MAGEAVRVSAGRREASPIAFDATRFDAVNAVIAATESKGTRRSPAFASGRPIWLGNLFDDGPHTPLAQAMRSDTFGATPEALKTLGVQRVYYGGDPLKEIATGVRFNLATLGWQAGSGPDARIANDSWTHEPPHGTKFVDIGDSRNILSGSCTVTLATGAALQPNFGPASAIIDGFGAVGLGRRSGDLCE